MRKLTAGPRAGRDADDRDEVCDMAGLDGDHVRHVALKWIEADGLLDRIVPAPWGGKLSGRAYIRRRLIDLQLAGAPGFSVAAFKELLAETVALCATKGRAQYVRPTGKERATSGDLQASASEAVTA